MGPYGYRDTRWGTEELDHTAVGKGMWGGRLPDSCEAVDAELAGGGVSQSKERTSSTVKESGGPASEYAAVQSFFWVIFTAGGACARGGGYGRCQGGGRFGKKLGRRARRARRAVAPDKRRKSRSHGQRLSALKSELNGDRSRGHCVSPLSEIEDPPILESRSGMQGDARGETAG